MMIQTMIFWQRSVWLCGVMVGLVFGGFGFASEGRLWGQDDILVKQKREDDSRMVDGLRRRRLFEIAEAFCRQELARPNIDPTAEASMTIELLKTLTARAVLSPADQRTAAWLAVNQVVEQFVQAHPKHPRLFLVQGQNGLSHIAHAELLQQELAAEMAPASDREQAFLEIRKSRSLLGDLMREITKMIPERRGRKLDEHELTAEQLMSLNNNIRYQLVVCNLSRAKLYGKTDRLNRIDALNVVQQKLTEVQRRASEGQPLWWNAKLGQIECFLLLGQPERAKTLFESLPTDDLTNNIRTLLLESKTDLAIALGDVAFSQSVVKEVSEIDNATPRLKLALVELAMDLSSRAAADNIKKQWLDFASKTTRRIELEHGAYWGRRAGLVLIKGVGVVPGNVTGQNKPIQKNRDPDVATGDSSGNANSGNASMSTELDLLVRLADQAFDKQRYDDALKAYDRAADRAGQEGNVEQALRLVIRASQVLEKQDKHRLAATRLLESSKREPGLALASAAHLRGCWNFAQPGSDGSPGDPKRFEEILAEHLQIWPISSSASQVRIWLAGRFQTRKDWRAAFDMYVTVPVDSSHLPVAVTQASVCARQILLEMRGQGKSTRTAAAELIQKLGEKHREVAKQKIVAMKLALIQIELDLVFGSNQPNPASVTTLPLIEASEETELRNSARAIHSVLICLHSPDEAKQLVGEFADDLASLELSDRCLDAMIQNSGEGASSVNASEVRLVVIERALENLQSEISAASRPANLTSWLLRQSRVLSSLNRHAEAIGVLTKLEKEFPRSAEIKMELARGMTLQYQDEDPVKPLAKWRRIAGQLRPHTARWYEAKYNVALLIFKSGNNAEAEKLLKFIQAIPPGWDQSIFKSRFDKLLKATESGG